MTDLEETRKLYNTYLNRRINGEITQEELEKESAYITITHTINYFNPKELPIKPPKVMEFEYNKDKLKRSEREELLNHDFEIKNYYNDHYATKESNRSNFIFLLKLWDIFNELGDTSSRNKVEDKLMMYNRDNMSLWIEEKLRDTLEKWITLKRSYINV